MRIESGYPMLPQQDQLAVRLGWIRLEEAGQQ